MNGGRTESSLVPQLDGIDNEQLNHWLCRFVMEVRSQSGTCYNTGTLYGICSGLQRFFREKRDLSGHKEELDIYKGHQFSLFRSSFDAILKDLHAKGVGTKKKQAEVI